MTPKSGSDSMASLIVTRELLVQRPPVCFVD
jgi:hypothetical protein